MGGDYTRVTFDPVKGFSGLHKQQGRVSLDWEFNEFEQILDRRDRAEMYDGVGQTFVPATTPDGFKIDVGGAGQLTIDVGRAYVDGILAESFGDMSSPASTVLDENLGGVHGPAPVDYDRQPFFYEPAYPALSAASGTIDLVYLDIWQREVSVFEDPALREIALNGPDTATRVQTAWQVKVLQNVPSTSCVTPPPAWTALTAPSTARITAGTTPVVPAPGPCVINPASGYTGLENRLYRVEIHKAGTLDGPTKAQFKWSRDNASLASRVLSIASAGAGQSTLTVASTGRDAWMRFDHGDHLELLDDFVEWAMRETGTGGPLATIVSVNHATGEILVDQDLSGFVVAAARHPRIRRWDIASALEPLVREVNNGTPIPLEDGITVTFGPTAADTLHAGDYIVFAARTADGTIDIVDNAPPQGILHHFARLALVTAGKPPTVLTDCRLPPSGDGECCCVRVKPSQTGQLQSIINAAVGQAGAAQVAIQLEPGTYVLKTPLVLDARHKGLTLEACAGAPVLTGTENKSFAHGLIWALGVEDVTIRGLDFQVTAQIIPDDVRNLIHAWGFDFLTQFSVGIRAIQCLSLTVQACHFRLAGNPSTFSSGILVQGDNGRIDSLQCRFTGELANKTFLAFGICLAPVLLETGQLQTSSAEVLRVTGNEFSFVDTGIVLSSRPLYVSVEENVTRLVRCSLSVVWHALQSPDEFPALFVTGTEPASVKRFIENFVNDEPSVLATAMPMVLPLGELKGLIDISKQTRIYTLGDTAIDAVNGFTLSAPAHLRLTLRGNRFDSRFLGTQITSGVDTLVWVPKPTQFSLEDETAYVTITDNTMWNFSYELPTVAVLTIPPTSGSTLNLMFDVTGNVLGNASPPTFELPLALIVNPSDVFVKWFTVSGNTIFRRSNLADFVRKEMKVQLPAEFAGPLLTWEFFNTTG